MAKLPGSFNADEHEEMGDFKPLPKGDYVMKIVESDYKENSKKTGHFLSLKREVVAPAEYAGRFFFSNLNLDNPNATAVEIAQKEFTSTCRACGKVVVEDSEELHGIEHTVSLAVKKGTGDNPDQNTVQAIKPLEGAASPAAGGKAAAATAKPISTGAAKPARKKPIFE